MIGRSSKSVGFPLVLFFNRERARGAHGIVYMAQLGVDKSFSRAMASLCRALPRNYLATYLIDHLTGSVAASRNLMIRSLPKTGLRSSRR